MQSDQALYTFGLPTVTDYHLDIPKIDTGLVRIFKKFSMLRVKRVGCHGRGGMGYGGTITYCSQLILNSRLLVFLFGHRDKYFIYFQPENKTHF